MVQRTGVAARDTVPSTSTYVAAFNGI